MAFVGRQREMGYLADLLAQVEHGGDRPGRSIAIRGRRRVGKSRMLTEFVRRAGIPYFYFTAEGGPTEQELARFAADLGDSSIPDAAGIGVPGTWSDALRQLDLVLPRNSPAVVVIDEVPYLSRTDPGFEGALQAAWDTRLSARPVLLVLIGSDRSEMERLTSYGRPFYGRATELSLGPLTVQDVAEMTGTNAADAIDAYLITGGLPLVLTEWRHGESVRDFLARSVASPVSALLVSGERVMSAEFPVEAQAAKILRVIGHGERSFTKIASAAGVPEGSLSRALDLLTDRQVVVGEAPLSTRRTKNTRYRVEDPYMRFWLAFLSDGIRRIDQGQHEQVLARIDSRWDAWRGRAVEPVVRDLLSRTSDLVPESAEIGSWWTRTNAVEVDLVGADSAPVATSIAFVGSVKWRRDAPFSHRDLADLIKHRDLVPGADAETPLVAVARSQIDAPGVIGIRPEDLVEGERTARAG